MRRLPLNILKLLGIIVLLIFLFLSSNYTINWFERNYNNDVDYQSLKEYSHKLGLSENYAIVVNFEKPSGKHRFFVCDLINNRLYQVVYALMELETGVL